MEDLLTNRSLVFFVVCCEIIFMRKLLLVIEPYLVDSLRKSRVWCLLCIEYNYSKGE